jgi:tetratricopeptide (TPR) repeat protein
LTCSILTSESGIRIIAKLIDAQSERQLWGDTYDGEAKDSLRFLSVTADAIAGQVASHLRIAWSAAADYTVTYSTNDEANRDYLRGRHHLAKDDRENLEKAEEHFLNAIQLDDAFAQAYAGLADVYILMGSDGFLTMENAYKRAREAATAALRINRKLPEAHTSLAAIAGDYDWDWDEAERHLQAAVDQDGGYEPSARLYSFYLACMGRADEARRFAEHALRLAPASAQASMNLAVVHYLARRYPEAISVLEEVTLDLEPEFGPAHVMLGRIYAAQGLHERAIEQLQHARRLMGARPDVVTPLAYVLARANRRHEALEAAQELKRIAAPGMPSPFRMAMVDIGLGNTDGAFAGLQRAFAAHDWQVTLLKVEPAFDDLRSDKRFEDLLDQVGLSRR